MFKWLKKNPAPQKLEIRDTLFGDTPLSLFADGPPERTSLEPFASFYRAKQYSDSRDKLNAISALRSVLDMPQLESRFYLQAHHCLRELGVDVDPQRAKDVLGVVVEVGMDGGLDLIAGYADHHARYYNYRGSGVMWGRPNDLFDATIDELLRRAAVVAQATGLWKKPRPPAPPKGHVRINLLVLGGLHFGQGPFDVLAKDRFGGPVLASAFQLMKELIEFSQSHPPNKAS